MFFINRQLLRQAQSPASGNDRNLMNGIGSRYQSSHQRVTRFMIRRIALFFIADHHTFSFRAH
jgi:hypothetical protein